MQVFILGMHRSGTSALARVLNLMGLYFGPEQASTGRNPENQKGFWERRDVRSLNDTILFNANCDWDCVSAFRADTLPSERIDDYRATMGNIVMDMDAHRPWFLKEPRFCLLFPVWATVLEMPFCIHIHRNPLEVAHSLKVRNGIPIRVGLALWELYNRLALQASDGLPRHIVSYAELLDNPTATVGTIHEALRRYSTYDLRVPATRELAAFLDQGLRHHRRELRSLRAVATTSQLDLYGALNGTGRLDAIANAALPTKTVDTLASYEANIDIGARIKLWRAGNERRSEPNLKTQLALADLELRHALSTGEQTQAVRRELADKLSRRELELRDLATKLATRDETIRSSRQTIEQTQAVRRDLAEKLSRRELELRDLATKLATRDETIRSSRQTIEQTQAVRRDLAEKLSRRELELRDLATKLATRDETIRSSRQTIAQAQRARRDVSTKLAKRDMEVRDLTTKLAVRDVQLQTSRKTVEHAQAERRDLTAKLSNRESEVRQLERAKNGLEQTRFALEQDRERLRKENTALQQKADVDARERSALTRNRDRLAGERDTLQRQRDALHRYKVNVQAEASTHRAQARQSLQSLDAQIALAKGQVVELEELTGHLRHGLEACLHSRRWRLGSILLFVHPRSLIRGRRHTISSRLQEAVAAHRAAQRAPGIVADYRNKLLDFGLAGFQPRVADESVGADAARRLALSRMLSERCAELGRHRSEIAVLRIFADQLAALVASLQASRRWRLGNLLLSLHRRLLGKGRPATAVDAMSALVAEYRSDKSVPPEEVPTPVLADRSGGTSEKAQAAPEHPQAVERDRFDVPEPPDAAADPHPAPSPPVAGSPNPLAAKREPDAERRQSIMRGAQASAVYAGSVDVVVCVHNAIEDVRQCLSSVLTRSTVDFRLIVVNDGSDAETTTWLRQFTANAKADVELIETNGPLGYTCAANQGLTASRADHVVLLNSDTIVPRLWLEDLLDCMRSNDDVGIVGPLSNAASYQSVPEVVDGGEWAVNDLPPGYNVDEFAELVHRVSRREFPRVDFVNGFCFMIKRRVIEKVGLLDEVTFPKGYGEENDYCLRAQAEGFALAIADQCFVYHGKSKSFGHAARLRLAKAGGQALREKHGDEKIEEGGARLRNSPALRNIREAVKSRLQNVAELTANASTDPNTERVLFVLPIRGGSGGANSVIQEVMGMRALGVDAKVATHVKYLKDFERFYADLLAEDVYFVFFDSDQDLLDKASDFDVIVATLWSSPAQIAPVAVRFPEKLYVYYVQDYEPWFFPADAKSRAIATDSYTLIPDMVLMAKTDWICRTVRERHGRDVYRVAPSLDHGIYYPPAERDASPSRVRVAAMIRPTTPRRAPLRTLRVLQDVAQRVDKNVSMLLFGCEPQNLTTYVRRNAPDLHLDGSFENRGILPREGVADLLREADVFVDFSDYQAFGRTGLEAMACGCAVVLPAVGGIYEYAVDGDNCLAVDTSSVDDMASALTRILQDSKLRARLKERGLATAARFDVARASLSELSVFRVATALQARNRSADSATYRRHEDPVTGSQAVARVLVGTTSSHCRENDALTQRVLLPLRHRALRSAVRVHEADAIEALDDAASGVCIVYDGTVQTTGEAQQVLDRCLAINADLIYGVARLLDFGNSRPEADAAAEFLVKNATRVVVPSEVVRANVEPYAAEVVVVAPALDERLWLEDTIHGERTLRDDPDDRLRCVVLGFGEDPVDRVVQDALAELSDTLAADVMPRRPDGSSGERAHVDHVKQLRACNRWQIGLLPAREDTPDADLKFLSLAALGCSVVCSSQGVHSTIARHRENAVVVDNTPAAWADGLRQLAADRDLRIAIREQAKLELETRHLLNRSAPAHLRAFVGENQGAQKRT